MHQRRVVHLTSVHPAHDTRIFLKECVSLAEAGFDVTLIAPSDRDEVKGSVKIKAIPRYSNRFLRVILGSWAVLRSSVRVGGELYHFHDPELCVVGWILKALGKRVIYDAHEDVVGSLSSREWLPATLRGALIAVVRLCLRLTESMTDCILVATPAIARTFRAKRVVVIQNYPLSDEFDKVESVPYAQRAPRVIYVGSITRVRGAVQMVSAIGTIAEDKRVVFDLAGACSPEELQEQLEALPGAERTVFHGSVDRQKLAALLGEARAGLVLFLPEPNHIESQPNKLFEYWSAGLPVIASDFPLWRSIIERHRCGIVVDPTSLEEIAKAIEWIVENEAESKQMGRRGRRAIEVEFNWDSQKRVLVETYEGILG